MRFSALLAFLFFTLKPFAQSTFPVNGTMQPDKQLYAITNATIFLDYKTKLEKATILFRDGKIVDCSQMAKIPSDAIVWDAQGKYIYPSFVDPYAEYGIQEIKMPEQQVSEYQSKRSGAYNWNEAVKPEFSAATAFQPSAKDAESYRNLGFGVVLTARHDGVVRGTGALVTLGNDKAHNEIIKTEAASLFAFDKGTSRQHYPSSLTGMIALIRQTYYDGRWYDKAGKQLEPNLSLEAFQKNLKLPTIFECKDKYDILRAAKIAKEFGVAYTYKGNGDEYQRLNEIKNLGSSLIIPMELPELLDLSNPFDARLVSLAELKHWELAPYNASMLEKAAIPFAFTLKGLKDKNNFWARIRKFVEYGLSKEAALKALTHEPAKILNASDAIGSLHPGKLANFIVSSGDVFEDKSIIFHHYINGRKFEINTIPTIDIRGNYNLNISDEKISGLKLKISGQVHAPAAEITQFDTIKIKSDLKLNLNLITISFGSQKLGGIYRLSGTQTGNNLTGMAESPAGKMTRWTASFESEWKQETKKDSAKVTPEPGKVWYPFQAYGSEKKPERNTYLVKNTTVWTSEKEGILQNMDVLIQNGKIAKVGKNLNASGAIEIDGKGKHLTAGIIDEHSHIAMTRGVNESGTSVSSEVRMGDVIYPDDINIYRHLAGGVTAAQLLHGSANSVGGQSALVKMRWGAEPEEMKFYPYDKEGDGFIKFALGENVKQSNWGGGWRYPQTRLGVEQVYWHYFIKAKEYEKELKANKDKTRRDLRLDALVEILNKKRFITCHSYVQSEINMLMKVADSLGFKVNTFTHILEGYKVADKMKEHGVGGSTFSDWWAYKWEVNDAIPYNAALMTKAGVITAMNSDDAEMARRLNQEAAKSVKYGGLSKEEAWKTVTINPAILLHLDKRTGSIKEGKDADVVLWSDDPLSIYARAEKTFVDGILYFDIEKDAALRKSNEEERTRLIQKILNEAASKGEKGKKPEKKEQHLYHCEDIMVDDFE
jgi:imidazolonepropionase-like amidohydrolase